MPFKCRARLQDRRASRRRWCPKARMPPVTAKARWRRSTTVAYGQERRDRLGWAFQRCSCRRCRHCEPRHRPLANAPVNRCGKETEPDRDPPHQIVIAVEVVKPAGAPAAEKAAELMPEEHDAPEHRHMRRTEHVADKPARQRNSAEPKKSARGRKDTHRDTR